MYGHIDGHRVAVLSQEVDGAEIRTHEDNPMRCLPRLFWDHQKLI